MENLILAQAVRRQAEEVAEEPAFALSIERIVQMYSEHPLASRLNPVEADSRVQELFGGVKSVEDVQEIGAKITSEATESLVDVVHEKDFTSPENSTVWQLLHKATGGADNSDEEAEVEAEVDTNAETAEPAESEAKSEAAEAEDIDNEQTPAATVEATSEALTSNDGNDIEAQEVELAAIKKQSNSEARDLQISRAVEGATEDTIEAVEEAEKEKDEESESDVSEDSEDQANEDEAEADEHEVDASAKPSSAEVEETEAAKDAPVEKDDDEIDEDSETSPKESEDGEEAAEPEKAKADEAVTKVKDEEDEDDDAEAEAEEEGTGEEAEEEAEGEAEEQESADVPSASPSPPRLRRSTRHQEPKEPKVSPKPSPKPSPKEEPVEPSTPAEPRTSRRIHKRKLSEAQPKLRQESPRPASSSPASPGATADAKRRKVRKRRKPTPRAVAWVKDFGLAQTFMLDDPDVVIKLKEPVDLEDACEDEVIETPEELALAVLKTYADHTMANSDPEELTIAIEDADKFIKSCKLLER